MVKAIIWDYDETLVDTRHKNLNVTRLVMDEVLGPSSRDLWGLQSLPNYVEVHNRSKNWMTLYQNEFGLTPEQVQIAGSLWTKYQLQDSSTVEYFDGIENTVHTFKNYSQGIVSQNSLQNMQNHLTKTGMHKYFRHIIGYEQVPKTKQKPHPEGLLNCINVLTRLGNSDQVVYIGDHETDSESAFRANEWFGKKVVINIGVFFSKPDHTSTWEFIPDYTVHQPEDIIPLVHKINN